MPARFPAPALSAVARSTPAFPRRFSLPAIVLTLALSCVWPASSALAQDTSQDTAKQLDAVIVNGTRIDDVEGGRVGTKMDVPLRETPQSVSVVTRDQMDRRGVQTVEEALRYSAGTSLPYGYDQRYDWVDVRGFQTVSDMYRDGLSQQGSSFGIPRFDPYALERVEVLKGPAGVMYGAGSPGGLINLVSKRPVADQRNEIGATVGMHDHHELRGDIGGALGIGSSWLYRIVALASETKTEVDYNFSRKWLLMPSLQWHNDTTTVDLQATWQRTRSRQGNASTVAPALRDVLAMQDIRIDVPRNRFVGEPGFDRFDPDYRTFGWTVEHRFNDALTLRQNTRHNRTDLDYRSHYLISLDPVNPYEAQRQNLVVDESSRGIVSDTGLEWKVGSGRVAHTLLLGLDYRTVENDENDGYGVGQNLNLLAPVYGLPITVPDQSLTVTRGRQLGVYVQDHIKFDDRWVLLLGGRYDKARTASRTDGFDLRSRSDDDAFSGRAGLVYVGAGGIAPYISYSESFQPVNGADQNARPFEPETGRQTEIGARWQPVGSDVLISAAIFDIRRENIVVTDQFTSLSSQLGEARSRGFEAEVNTMILPSTRLVAAATYLDTETLKGDANYPTGSPLPLVPRRSFSAYVDHTLTEGVLAGLNLGAGVRYVGESTFATYQVLDPSLRLDVDTPAYTLLDANIEFPWQDWTFSLTGNNLTDKDYSIGCNAVSCYRGYGRRLDLSVRYRW